MKVRPLADADVEDVIALWERCGLTRPWNDPRQDIAFARGKPSSDILVGEAEGRIVGSVMLGHDGHRGAIYYLAVTPEEQGTGKGRALVAEAEAWLKARGAWKINLLVRHDNAKVKAFYESLGYRLNEAFSMARKLT
jgi:hypothetical protein